MTSKNKTLESVHWSFWAIGAVALIWNAMGVMNYFAQMNAETVASMPDAYQVVIKGRPTWATGAFATAVFGGALGCVLLMLRKSVAVYLFIASLLGVIATMIHALGVNSSSNDFSPVWIGATMSLMVAAFLIWYSKQAERKGWIS